MKESFYEKKTDEQLVALVKAGNEEPFGVLLNRYMPYIIRAASRYKSVLDAEDLVNEGVLAFFSAVKSYQPEKSSFRSFAGLCVDRAVLSEYRCSKALKRIPSELISSIDDVVMEDTESPESLFIEKESFKNLFASVSARLSDLEYSVFCEFLTGKSYKEIAEITGKTEKSVDNALKRIREKLKR